MEKRQISCMLRENLIGIKGDDNNMAMIKCPECGQEISDKAKKCVHCGAIYIGREEHCTECGAELEEGMTECPNCGYPINLPQKTNRIKSDKKNIVCIMVIAIFIFGILSFFILKCRYNKINPPIIGDIRLNMSQKDVENILHKKIGNDLFYADSNYDTDGEKICIFQDEIHKVDGNKKIDDLYSTGIVSFYFDKNNKLQKVGTSFMSTTVMMSDVLKNFGLGLKDDNIDSYYPGVNSVKFYYGTVGDTYIEFSDRLDGVDKDFQIITYMRKKDVGKRNKNVN